MVIYKYNTIYIYIFRSLDSPSAALDMVTATQQRTQESVTVTLTPSNIPPLLEDSDTEAEPDPPDWTRRVDENVLKSMTPREKKRQEVINGEKIFFIGEKMLSINFPRLFNFICRLIPKFIQTACRSY